MRKHAFAYMKPRGQLRSSGTADQCLCFHYIDNTIPLLPKIQQKVNKAHIPPAVAIRGHTTLIGKKEKWTNKG